jgi:hypothetical protein
MIVGIVQKIGKNLMACILYTLELNLSFRDAASELVDFVIRRFAGNFRGHHLNLLREHGVRKDRPI